MTHSQHVLLSPEEGKIKQGRILINKLEEISFDDQAVIMFRLKSMIFCNCIIIVIAFAILGMLRTHPSLSVF